MYYGLVGLNHKTGRIVNHALLAEVYMKVCEKQDLESASSFPLDESLNPLLLNDMDAFLLVKLYRETWNEQLYIFMFMLSLSLYVVSFFLLLLILATFLFIPPRLMLLFTCVLMLFFFFFSLFFLSNFLALACHKGVNLIAFTAGWSIAIKKWAVK